MAVTGERSNNKQQLATSLLNAPIVSQADLLNPDSLINQRSSSGKQRGAMVYVELTGGELTTAVAQGPASTDPWLFFTADSIPVVPVRRKMEVFYDGLSWPVSITESNLLQQLTGLTPTSGSLNSFVNTATNKLNVYNDDASLFFKAKITGTWNSASTNPNTLQIHFSGGTAGNIVNSIKTSGMDADDLQFITFLSVDKDGSLQATGSTLTINTIDTDFTINSILLIVEQVTSATSITPV